MKARQDCGTLQVTGTASGTDQATARQAAWPGILINPEQKVMEAIG